MVEYSYCTYYFIYWGVSTPWQNGKRLRRVSFVKRVDDEGEKQVCSPCVYGKIFRYESKCAYMYR